MYSSDPNAKLKNRSPPADPSPNWNWNSRTDASRVAVPASAVRSASPAPLKHTLKLRKAVLGRETFDGSRVSVRARKVRHVAAAEHDAGRKANGRGGTPSKGASLARGAGQRWRAHDVDAGAKQCTGQRGCVGTGGHDRCRQRQGGDSECQQ